MLRTLAQTAAVGTFMEICILGQVVSENYFMMLGAGVITTLSGCVAYLYKVGLEDRKELRNELNECQADREKLWQNQAAMWERVAKVEKRLGTAE